VYVRYKIIKGHLYYYLVKGVREGGKVRQKVVKYLGKHPGAYGTVRAAPSGAAAEAVRESAALVFAGFPDVTTAVLEQLRGRRTVSKQFIADLARSPLLRKAEQEMIAKALAQMPDGQVSVQEFAEKVKAEVVPLCIQVQKSASIPLANELKRLRSEIEQETGKNPQIAVYEVVVKDNPPQYSERTLGKLKRIAEIENMLEQMDDFYFPTNPARYENISLPEDISGEIKNYEEHIYKSPIKTSAGDVHFSPLGIPDYFAHTRVEDMADDKVRRVIEVQSDLFQRGRLERLVTEGLDCIPKKIVDAYNHAYGTRFAEEEIRRIPVGQLRRETAPALEGGVAEFDALINQTAVPDNIAKLKPYEDTWYERIIGEEIKGAAQEGMTRLQFPTGVTALKIEGLGDREFWYDVSDHSASRLTELEVGKEIRQGLGGRWIITDVLGDGKFKAVPRNVADAEKAWTTVKDTYTPPSNQKYLARNSQTGEVVQFPTSKEADQYIEDAIRRANDQYAETFDISGKVDTSNPIYRFYEHRVQRCLKRFRPTMQRVTDPQGVTWFEIPLEPSDATRPVAAFGAISSDRAKQSRQQHS
jgi:hypothetical protein